MQEPELFLLFLKPLNRLKVVYMVTGATAAIVYGAPRLTNDLDLVLRLTIDQISDFRTAFSEEDFYVPPEDIIAMEISREQRGHLNLLHLETGFKADCYLAGKDPLHTWALKNRREFQIENETIWVAPPEYVILRKLEYFREGGSEKHLNDIRNMIRISQKEIDFHLLKEKMAQLDLNNQWNLVESD